MGVAIDTLDDVVALFDGIPLDQVSTSMTINAPAPVLVAMYVVAAELQGVPAASVRGTAQNDVLKEYVARGTYIYPPRPSLRLAADLVAWCATEAPRFNAISLSGYHIREAGSTAAQEMAFALANAIAYVEAVLAHGVAIDDFAPRLSWIFNTHTNFFEEIAKYRALRRMWATLMRDRFGALDPRSLQLRTHTQTGGSTLTLQQPENNIVRAALQALAAVLGGVQSLALSCYDEAIAIPTEHAQTLAVRTQQILAEEIGVTDTADPLGGSWYIESLTDELERRAGELLAEVERIGGAVAAVETGFYQRAIDEEAYRAEMALESGERVVVGVNRHREGDDPEPAFFQVDPALVGRPDRAPRRRARGARRRSGGGGAGGAARRLRGRRGQRACRRSSSPCAPAPRWARSAARCAACSASTSPSTCSRSARSTVRRRGIDRVAPLADVWGVDTRPPSNAEHASAPPGAPAPTWLSEFAGANFDVLALAFSVIFFLIAASAAPDSSCGAGQVAEGGAIFDACAVLSPLALVVAAFAAVVCRRDITSKIAAFVLYGGAAVPIFVGLAQAGAPCGL